MKYFLVFLGIMMAAVGIDSLAHHSETLTDIAMSVGYFIIGIVWSTYWGRQ